MNFRRPPIEVSLQEQPRLLAVFALKRHLGAELFNAYKTCIDGARYDQTDRTNKAELDKVIPILRRLKEAGFEAFIEPKLREALMRLSEEKKKTVQAAEGRAEKVDVELRKRGLHLFPYQRIGVNTLASKSGFLLSDEPGCGKSVQALLAHPATAPLLIACPNALKGVWVGEAAKFRPDLRPYVMDGRGRFRWPRAGEMGVINYDILQVDSDVMGQPVAPQGLEHGTTIVFDEVHSLKSFKSKRHIKGRCLAEAVRRANGRSWGLTGTPILSRPTDLWGVLQVLGLAHEAFGSYGNFVSLFGGFIDDGGITHWANHPDEQVAERLRRVSLCRLKKDVLLDLPEKLYRIIDASIDSSVKEIADKAWEEIQAAGVDLESAEAYAKFQNEVQFETISKARKALATAKIPALLELLDVLEDAEEQVVVFSRHREPIDLLARRKAWGNITGDNSREAFKTAQAFQAGHLKGIAATIQSGGTGITLTRACNVIFLDRDWTPALNEQAEDRLCRLTQTRGVVVSILLADHALDKHVEKVLRKKHSIIEGSVKASAVSGDYMPRPEFGEEGELDTKQQVERDDEVRRRFADIVAESGEAGGQGPNSVASPVATPIGVPLVLIMKARDVGVARAEGHLEEGLYSIVELDVLHALDKMFVRQSRSLTRKQYELLALIFQGDIT